MDSVESILNSKIQELNALEAEVVVLRQKWVGGKGPVAAKEGQIKELSGEINRLKRIKSKLVAQAGGAAQVAEDRKKRAAAAFAAAAK